MDSDKVNSSSKRQMTDFSSSYRAKAQKGTCTLFTQLTH